MPDQRFEEAEAKLAMARAEQREQRGDPERIGVAIPEWLANLKPLVLDEAELQARERDLHREARRERLMNSPIRESLSASQDENGRVVTDESLILHDRCEPTMALEAVRRWVGKWSNVHSASVTRPVLILAGPPGIGKSVAAAWAVAEVGARYVRFPELIEDHRAFQRKAGIRELEHERDMFATKYVRPGFVVLDELGIEGERDAEAAKEALAYFVEKRQLWHQRTLMLTNKSNAELLARFETGQYDQRTLDRLRRLLITADVDENRIALDLKGRSMRRSARAAKPAARGA